VRDKSQTIFDTLLQNPERDMVIMSICNCGEYDIDNSHNRTCAINRCSCRNAGIGTHTKNCLGIDTYLNWLNTVCNVSKSDTPQQIRAKIENQKNVQTTNILEMENHIALQKESAFDFKAKLRKMMKNLS
jgi:hypothetical protein